MANRIQLKRGIQSKLPILMQGEPAYTTDTYEFFVGTGSGNVNMGGSQWLTGTSISGSSGTHSYSDCPLVKHGDKYLNTSNGNVYECTTAGSGEAAVWTYKGCIRGAEGAQGPAGPAGSAGTTAEKLAAAQGIDGVDFDGSAAITHYGTCSTPAATAEKTVSITGFKLVTGARVFVKFSEANTASSPMLKVSDTDAKSIRFNGANAAPSKLGSGIYEFIYDGTYWQAVGRSNLIYSDGVKKVIEGAYGVIIGANNSTLESGMYSCICGGENNQMNSLGDSCICGGSGNNVTGNSAFVGGGNNNNVLDHQAKFGHYSTDGTGGNDFATTGDAVIVGNGTNNAKSNAFRVAYSGDVYGKGSFHSEGADYAEFFEWADGNPENEDRTGLFVTLDGDKIRIANADDDYILGVVSAAPGVIGNDHADTWQGMWLTDVFGRVMTHTVHHDAKYDGDRLVREAYDAEEPIVNPDYNPDEKYIPRGERKEWGVVGLMGQLIVIDDGTCAVNGNCAVFGGGKATASENGYRVLARLDDMHVKVMFR